MESEDNWTIVQNKRRKPFKNFSEDGGTEEHEFFRPRHSQGVHQQGLHSQGVHPQGLHPQGVHPQNEKIAEPCWFYNNGGCRRKDGSDKAADDCKYLHVLSENVRRPPHLCTCKPCDKFNLEGDCKWHDSCKYSHRNLTTEEWSKFYPGIPYTLKANVQKRLILEGKIQSIEGRMKVLEYKQEGMSRDLQNIGRMVQQILRKLEL